MSKRFLFLIILLMATLGLISYKITHAFFSDTASSTGNIFAASTLFPTPTITITPSISPSPTPTVNPGDVVVNEVYYDVDASHGGNEGDDANPDEWIELYNKTSSPVNLKNWKIVDNSGIERSISEANVDIPANGFAILAKSASTFTQWSIPSGVEKISIGQKFGNGLANDGDRVILKDNNGNTIDQMSYGTDITILNPSETDVIEGHSLERDPDGTDSDTNADFVDRSTPTPGT